MGCKDLAWIVERVGTGSKTEYGPCPHNLPLKILNLSPSVLRNPHLKVNCKVRGLYLCASLGRRVRNHQVLKEVREPKPVYHPDTEESAQVTDTQLPLQL